MKKEKNFTKDSKIILTLVMLVLAILFFSTSAYAIQTTSLTINPTNMTLKVGETKDLVITQKVSDYGSWGIQGSSYDPSIIELTSKGKENLSSGIGTNFKYKVKGLKPGTVTLTWKANDNSKTATCKITVTAKNGS